MFKRFKYALILGPILYSCANWAKYSMVDLSILYQQKAHQEFLDHVYDIPPTDRDKKWQEMYIDTAANWIDDQLEQKRFTPSLMLKLSQYEQKPTLYRSEYFRSKRELYGVAYFQHLEQTTEHNKWYTQLDKFSTALPLFDETRLKLGLVYWRRLEPKKAWKIWKPLVLKANVEFCQQKELIEALLENYRVSNKEEKYSPSCLKKMTPTIFSLTLKSASEDFPYDIYFLIEPWLQQEEKNLFLLTYFTSSPRPSPLLNKAWSYIRSLGQNYSFRRKLAQQINQEMNPLPGSIFALKKSNDFIFVRHLNQYFPEYLDHYFEKCHQFYSGKAFKGGNPTPYCRTLLNSSFVPKKWETKLKSALNLPLQTATNF